MRARLWQAITGCSEAVAHDLAKGYLRHGTSCKIEDLDAAVDYRETWQQYRDLDDELERRRRWGIDWEDLAWSNQHIAPKLGKAFVNDEIPW